MKNLLLYSLMFLMVLTLSSCTDSESIIPSGPEQPGQSDDNDADDENSTPIPEGNGRYLVLYCSRSGNTERIARQIHTTLNCDLLEVTPVMPYEDDYNAMLERAQREQAAIAAGIYPEIRTSVESFGSYEIIFIGYPVWYGHMATPMQSFLHTHAGKLSGKHIALFATSGNSDISTSVHEARELCTNAVFTETLHLTSSTISQCETRVNGWLTRLGATNAGNSEDKTNRNKMV